MRNLIAISACAALAACTTADLGKIDTAIQQGVPYLCAAARPFHSAFLLTAATGKVKAELVNKEAVAYNQLQGLCSDPSKATLITTLDAVTAAYIAIKNASIEAKKQTQ